MQLKQRKCIRQSDSEERREKCYQNVQPLFQEKKTINRIYIHTYIDQIYLSKVKCLNYLKKITPSCFSWCDETNIWDISILQSNLYKTTTLGTTLLIRIFFQWQKCAIVIWYFCWILQQIGFSRQHFFFNMPLPLVFLVVVVFVFLFF